MSTTKGIWRRAVLWTVAGVLGFAVGAARADEVTDQAAAILIFPKIQVDTSGVSSSIGARVDTEVQIVNTSGTLIKAHCFYVNGNSHCSNANPPTVPSVCQTNDDCLGGICVPPNSVRERDFQLTLTKRQPLSWRASEGLTGNDVPLSNGRTSKDGQTNGDTSIPPVTENPFVGELKCIQVDVGSEQPIDLNDMIGLATIVTTLPGPDGDVDARKSNAVGLQAIAGAQDGDPSTLNLGGPNAEYNACPNVNIIDHFFDSMELPSEDGVVTHAGMTVSGRVATDLIIVPCSEDFLNQQCAFGATVLQFLIYNEFEQRFSTSTRVNCYKDVQLSDIDTRPGTGDNISSIFSEAVQGTLTGQTRIRPVLGSTRAGRVLVIAEERWEADGPLGIRTTSRNVHNIQPLSPFDVPLSDVIQMTCPDGSTPPCF